ncbi:uncharacterized protein LOC6544381 [Drosophila erecta]|uniref:Chitin-binding type-2 domain-containing protein n=1 Tax=Drosophila erecta TaxID=7220 RepID=B3NH39_DROER|nr:uncharacterized protein LOC6544381 [Drosophila erecta]EDV51496.2 uncharacterized protein Dere_GG13867 [Drosophila erecta]
MRQGSAVICLGLLAFIAVVDCQAINNLAPTLTEHSIQCPPFDDPYHNVMLPYPNDCRKYYVCQKGRAFEYQCPPNLFWSQMTYRCDYKEYSNCNSDHPSSSQDVEVIFNAYPGDCSRFYETRILRCERNFQWSSLYQSCVPPQYGDCQNSAVALPPVYPITPVPPFPTLPTVSPYDPMPTAATPPSLNIAPTELNFLPIDVQSLCNISPPNAYIPYPGDCSKFIHCGPTATILSCADSLKWNPVQRACVISSNGCQF